MAGRKVGVETRGAGNWVYLRATLPPRDGSHRLRPYQQRIALGLPDIKENKQKIRAAAKRLEFELATETFSWDNWVAQKPTQQEALQTLDSLLAAFREYMLATRGMKPASFFTNYEEPLRRCLPADRLPTCEDMRKALAAYDKQSAARRILHLGLRLLAKYMGLDGCNLDEYAGSYSPKAVEPIDLPSDGYLIDFVDGIQRLDLRYLMGLLVTYGLRPHESWYASVDLETARCRVAEGKTGARIVSAHPRELVARWELHNPVLPNWTVATPRDVQTRLYKEIVIRCGFGYRLYVTRHCFARRAFEAGVPAAVAAKQMGHSERVFSDIYCRWIADANVLAAFERLTN